MALHQIYVKKPHHIQIKRYPVLPSNNKGILTFCGTEKTRTMLNLIFEIICHIYFFEKKTSTLKISGRTITSA